MYQLIHKEHHKTAYNSMIYSDTYVAHFLETPFQGLGIFFPLIFIKFNLFVFVCSMLLLNIRGMLRHDNRFTWLVGNHHAMHHKNPKCNFGEYWLDKLFGTEYKSISP